jgi:hypothetical protein
MGGGITLEAAAAETGESCAAFLSVSFIHKL